MSHVGWFVRTPTLALIFASQTSHVDYQTGLGAYKKGNYDIAMQAFNFIGIGLSC